MSPRWIAAAIAATVSAFAVAYALASPRSSGSPPVPELAHRFPRLQPGPAPRDWRQVRLPDRTAALFYPASWHVIAGDQGTVSAAVASRGRLVGYLNATPLNGAETPANWLSFRPDHNRDEGNTDVTPLAGARGLRFRTGHGSCLVDGYTTAARIRYRELACIVVGRKATTVVVGSAVPGRWSSLAPVLRRAVSSFTT
jgi:hypothetical protein